MKQGNGLNEVLGKHMLTESAYFVQHMLIPQNSGKQS